VTAPAEKSEADVPPRPRSRIVLFAGWVIVLGAIILVLRATPLLDPGIDELWGRLNVIRNEISQPGADWPARSEDARESLKSIADEARRAHQRRIGPWRLAVRPDRREIAALREIERIAESDLPALVAAGPKGHPLRQRTVDEALARVDDHLAGASPYLPPLKSIQNQAGLEKLRDRADSQTWIIAIVVVDVVILAAGIAWWIRLRSLSGRPA